MGNRRAVPNKAPKRKSPEPLKLKIQKQTKKKQENKKKENKASFNKPEKKLFRKICFHKNPINWFLAVFETTPGSYGN